MTISLTNTNCRLCTLCRSCHSWHHQQTSEDEIPVEITDADRAELLPHDIEIVQLLAEHGPATTGDITAALTAELTPMAVRERLWVLMGLDNVVEERDRQLIDQDADTGEWGLPGQIGQSARGRIPDDVQTLCQRFEDEHVRQALARGCSRETIAHVLGIHSRTTRHKEKRAKAYDFPLEVIDGRGGRPSVSESAKTARETGSEPSPSDADSQHELESNEQPPVLSP